MRSDERQRKNKYGPRTYEYQIISRIVDVYREIKANQAEPNLALWRSK